MISRAVALLLASAFSLTSASADLAASNVAVNSMHVVDDYFALIPMESLGAEKRKELLAKAIVKSYDSFSGKTGDYILDYIFLVPGLVVASHLVVVDPSRSATKVLNDLAEGTIAGSSRPGIEHREIKCAPKWSQECRYFVVIGQPKSPPTGNYLFVRKGQNVYFVSILGLGGFDNADDATDFLESKAKPLLDLKPQVRRK